MAFLLLDPWSFGSFSGEAPDRKIGEDRRRHFQRAGSPAVGLRRGKEREAQELPLEGLGARGRGRRWPRRREGWPAVVRWEKKGGAECRREARGVSSTAAMEGRR